MADEIVFSESEVEPIIGTAPSAYDSVVVFGDDEVEPIVGRPSPYQSTVVFDESDVEPIIGRARSLYDGSTAVPPVTGIDDPEPSAYDGVRASEGGTTVAAPRGRSPYGGVVAVPDDVGGAAPGPPRPRSPYDGLVAFDESEVEPIIGRRPRTYDGVVRARTITFPDAAGEVIRADPPRSAPFPVPEPPLLGRGPLRRGTISWELMDAWDLPRPSARLAGVSEAQLQVLSWLEAHRDKIVDVERRRHVDRRAIAAAIAWEALENTAWPFSRRAVGVGKVHTRSSVVRQVEAAGYLPRRTDADRTSILRDPDQAIEYIGAIMSAQADIAQKAGHDIRRRVDILTNEYNGRDLDQWRDQLARRDARAPLTPANRWLCGPATTPGTSSWPSDRRTRRLSRGHRRKPSICCSAVVPDDLPACFTAAQEIPGPPTCLRAASLDSP